ncbi:MAG: PHP domain-containing protein [Spirochaetia bacterium]|nr:PHP domain-containing protein [Spirochaetia bacterium]MCF7953145.1 PHP domain-containing protein [Spirochaetales bacterium]
MNYRIDLHNHSCLSPCGSLDMSPSAMVSQALKLGIDILAITDHNTCRNTPAFDRCCRDAGIFPVFGAEVTTEEEVHVVCLFPDLKTSTSFGRFIESLLPDTPNVPDVLGDQVYVDHNENILGEVEKSLLQSSNIPFDRLIDEVLSWNGMVIPAHIDRPSFSAVSQLGFLPDLPYTAVESVHIPCPYETYDKPVIRNSDAHYLQDMGKRSWSISLEELTFTEISKAISRRLYSLS